MQPVKLYIGMAAAAVTILAHAVNVIDPLPAAAALSRDSDLVPRNEPLMRTSPLRSGATMTLLAGALLTVKNVLPIIKTTIPAAMVIPELPTVELSIENLSQALGETKKAEFAKSITSIGWEYLVVGWEWADKAKMTPPMTSLEWETIFISLYRSMPGQPFDQMHAKLDIGGRIMHIGIALVQLGTQLPANYMDYRRISNS